jgi:hypothetical protein
MELNSFLEDNFRKLSFKDICETNNFLSYENFKKFIYDHYNLYHIENNNYIKYVKVKRQIIRLTNNEEYIKIINDINSIISYLSDLNIIPNINIRKYMYKINTFFKFINDKEKILLNTINKIRELFKIKDNYIFYLKIMNGINPLFEKYRIFKVKKRLLISLVDNLIEFELSYGIDHKLIELNNMERAFLGKKSEYTANKVISLFISNNKKKYFYLLNIDLLKLLNIDQNNYMKIKGELDGIILYHDGNNYIIEKIIEVKSSIKATFEDYPKFHFFKKYISSLSDDFIAYFDNYNFTKSSFQYIIDNDITKWLTYICINTCYKDVIEKSHFYFSHAIKIVDDNFIKSFYIDNNDDAIKDKYKIICKKRNIINKLYDIWQDNIKLGSDECNIYVLKK